MKSSEFSEVLIPGGTTRVLTTKGSGSSTKFNKWLVLIAAMFTLSIASMLVFYELRFAQYELRVTLMEKELNSFLQQRFEENKIYEQYYETELSNLEDEDDDDDDDDDLEDIDSEDLKQNRLYGEVKMTGEFSQGRKKRQIPIPTQTVFDPTVPRTQDGVPILDSSYLDKVGVVPSAPNHPLYHNRNLHEYSTPPPPTPGDNSEGLRLYESLVATGGRGEPKSPDFYPEATARSPILPHHRTSAAWSEKTGGRSGLQLKSGDLSSSGTQFADDVFYNKNSGSRNAVSSQNSNSHRIATSSVSGPTGQPGLTSSASSQFYSSQGTSGSSSNYLNRAGAGGNTVINRASRVPATEDFLYPQNSRARTIQYPPLKRFGQGDGEVVARVLQADNEADSVRPSHRTQAEANLGDTAGATAESRRSYKGGNNRRGGNDHQHRNARRHHGAKLQRKEVGDTGFDSDEINIVKAEAWVEGQKAVAAHYVADVSNYTTHHRHYEGNGRLKNADGIFSAWKMADWMAGNEASKAAFSLSSQGVLTVKQAGLYYIYAQIHYIDEHDINSFSVNINSTPFLQCTTMTETYNSGSKSNTCFTAGVSYLRENDRVLLRDIEVNRYSIFKPEKSFFGLMRLSGDSGVPKL